MLGIVKKLRFYKRIVKYAQIYFVYKRLYFQFSQNLLDKPGIILYNDTKMVNEAAKAGCESQKEYHLIDSVFLLLCVHLDHLRWKA